MKNKYLIVLCISALLLLGACGLSNISVPPLPTATPIPQYTAAPTPTPVPEIIPAGLENRVTIRIEDMDIVANDPVYGSIPILNFRYQLPHISIDNNDAAAEQINNTLSELNKQYISIDGDVSINMDKYNEMLSLATDSYDEENQFDFKFFRKADIVRADDNIIIISFTNTTIQFGNETVEEETHYFDSSTGVELSAELVTADAYPKADRIEKGELLIVDAVDGQYDVVDLVQIDEEGQDYIINCNGIVYDLNIGDDWYCNILNNSAVQIKVALDETSTGLFVSYISEGEQYTFIIIKDPDTGMAKLVNSAEVLG